MGISTWIRRSHHQAKSTASKVLDLSKQIIDRKQFEEENENMLKDYLRNKAIISKMQDKPFNSKEEEKFLGNMFAQKKQLKELALKDLKIPNLEEDIKQLKDQHIYREKPGEESVQHGYIRTAGSGKVSGRPSSKESKEGW